MTNDQLAAEFIKWADRLDLEEANPFRVRAYRRAALALQGLKTPVHSIAQNGGLRQIPGIGKELERKILDLLDGRETGPSEEESNAPTAFIPPPFKVPGLEPELLSRLCQRFLLETREDLERLARSRLLRTFPGLGRDLEKKILKEPESSEPF